tara:strand:- start:84 stop:380 length:297 start_codon:yes stop_codon:yes gene_type:complete
MNNLIAFGSENKSFSLENNNIDNKFEETFFKSSIPFDAYDNSENQIEMFFGKMIYANQSENTFYPDSFIINISEPLREIYKSKLNDMSINENKYNDYK